jgi:hypothetical protein
MFSLDKSLFVEITIIVQESLHMRKLLVALAMALLVIPAISQPTPVGGTFGETWLTNYGNRNVIPQANSLWDWGTIPKGQILSNGRLTELGPAELIYPAFPSSTTPIIINATTPGESIRSLNASQINNPYLVEDPWFVAQTTGQPVLFRQLPY